MTEQKTKWFNELRKAEKIVNKVFDEIVVESKGTNELDDTRFDVLMALCKIGSAGTNLFLKG